MPGFGWLHLTDLHAPGAGGMRTLWPNVEEQFLEDLGRLHDRTGPWDAVLFSGDLTQRGTPADFETLDELLGVLWDHLRALGSDPVLFTVPGNHDLVRPDPRRPEVRLLSRWESSPDIQQEFWSDAGSPYRKVVAEAFEPYEAWSERLAVRQPAELERGILPGDRSGVLEKDGLRLGLLGLNTSFLQLGEGNWHGRLAVHVSQFHGATDGNGPAWARNCDATLLITHHGPAWLDRTSREGLNGEIAPPGRFLAHLYGHMHEPSAEHVSVAGALPWRRWQGTSLFGLESFGGEVDRSHGYAVARLEIEGPGRASLRMWPRSARRHQAGFWQIGQDQSYTLEEDGGTPIEGVTLRRRRARLGTLPPGNEVLTLPPLDPPLTDAACQTLRSLAERVHDDEVARVSKLIARGEYVAILAPAGFRLSLAVRALAESLHRRKDLVAFRVTPLSLASTLDDWLDHLLRELSARVPGLQVVSRGNRLLALLYALQDSARSLWDKGSRLLVIVDPVESFGSEHRERLVRVLQVLAQLSEERTNDRSLEAVGVAMAGGEELHRILAGRVRFSADLSPVRASHQTVLSPVVAPETAESAVRDVVAAVGGHPELVRWAANRGGRTGGRPEDELPLFHDQINRFREAPYREQLQRMIAGEAAAWRDPDPALRWSGWLRLADPPGWLGHVLENLARRTVLG